MTQRSALGEGQLLSILHHSGKSQHAIVHHDLDAG